MSRTRRAFIRLLFPGVVIAAISCACAGVDYPFRAADFFICKALAHSSARAETQTVQSITVAV